MAGQHDAGHDTELHSDGGTILVVEVLRVCSWRVKHGGLIADRSKHARPQQVFPVLCELKLLAPPIASAVGLEQHMAPMQSHIHIHRYTDTTSALASFEVDHTHPCHTTYQVVDAFLEVIHQMTSPSFGVVR